MRPATTEEIERWDQLIAANPDGGNVLQSKPFAQTKAQFGWQPLYFIHEIAGKKLAVLYLARQVPVLGELVYATKGPGVASLDQLKEWAKQVKASKPHEFAVKIEPELLRSSVKPAELKRLGLVKAPRDIQYNVNTVIVDLKPTEEDILASFKQKTRYNVRLAERKGVKVEAAPPTEANFRAMYDLFAETGRRAGVYVRSYGYFQTFWQLHAAAGEGQLFFAKYEGKVLAGAFITFLGKKALYKDGGSSREHSNTMPTYLMQWEIMRWLKGHGIEEYDMHGTPPAGFDPSHPLASLAHFKTGFNAEITEYIGTYDLVLDKAKYRRWTRIGERLAAGYSHRVKKELFY